MNFERLSAPGAFRGSCRGKSSHFSKDLGDAVPTLEEVEQERRSAKPESADEKGSSSVPQCRRRASRENLILLTPSRNSTTQFELLKKGQTRKSTGKPRSANEKGSSGLPQKQTTSLAQKSFLLTLSKNLTTRFELLKKPIRKSTGETRIQSIEKRSSGLAKEVEDKLRGKSSGAATCAKETARQSVVVGSANLFVLRENDENKVQAKIASTPCVPMRVGRNG